jgi:hypothetical protein
MELDYFGEVVTARFGEWYTTPTTIIYEPIGYEISRLQPDAIGYWDGHLSEKRWYTGAVRDDFLIACEFYLRDTAIQEASR